MEISVEISMYPLSEGYKSQIKSFLKRLNTYQNISVETNGMSTQIFGKYDDVFDVLKNEIKEEYNKSNKVVFILKCVNEHLQEKYTRTDFE